METAQHHPMKPRLVARLAGKYRQAEYTGSNNSGIRPVGKRVLILTDVFEGTFAEGKLEFLAAQVERDNEAAESGTLICVGDEAFSIHADGATWKGVKPVAGDSVYFSKWAGIYVMGNDGQRYRLMEDSCVSAIYTVYAEEKGEDTNAKK